MNTEINALYDEECLSITPKYHCTQTIKYNEQSAFTLGDATFRYEMFCCLQYWSDCRSIAVIKRRPQILQQDLVVLACYNVNAHDSPTGLLHIWHYVNRSKTLCVIVHSTVLTFLSYFFSVLTAELQGKINTKTLLVNTLTHIAICASNDARQIRFLVASVACGKTAKPDCPT